MRTISRDEAIANIRRELSKLVDDEHSICEVAKERGIFCGGFSQFTNSELFQRYKWLAKRKGITRRADLEVAANRWQLQRQLALDKELACDVQAADHDTCDGWEEFENAKLEEFHREVCAEPVQIV